MSGTTSTVERVTALVELMVAQAEAVSAAEERLASAKEAYRRTEQEDLPELMRELGIESLTLRDGTAVSVSEDVQAGITEANRPAAHAWLRANGFSGLIRVAVSTPFGPDESDAAYALAERIAAEEGRTPEVDERVNPQTLRAFIRERLAAAQPLPLDLFGVHPFARAKVKAPKKK